MLKFIVSVVLIIIFSTCFIGCKPDEDYDHGDYMDYIYYDKYYDIDGYWQ